MKAKWFTFLSASPIAIVDSGFSVGVIILTLAEMLTLSEVLGGYGCIHGSLGDREFVRSQLGHARIQK